MGNLMGVGRVDYGKRENELTRCFAEDIGKLTDNLINFLTKKQIDEIILYLYGRKTELFSDNIVDEREVADVDIDYWKRQVDRLTATLEMQQAEIIDLKAQIKANPSMDENENLLNGTAGK